MLVIIPQLLQLIMRRGRAAAVFPKHKVLLELCRMSNLPAGIDVIGREVKVSLTRPVCDREEIDVGVQKRLVLQGA